MNSLTQGVVSLFILVTILKGNVYVRGTYFLFLKVAKDPSGL